ncbi:MAG: hypothetical protein WB783_01360 [Arenicellales bacterium]
MPPDFRHKIPFENLSIVHELAKIAVLRGELGIYWSIKVELFFYLVYPFIITLCLFCRNKAGALFLLVAALMFLNHFPDGLGRLSWHVPLPGVWTGYTSIFVAGVPCRRHREAEPPFAGR